MRIALYILIFIGSVVLSLDLYSKVKNIEPDPVPETPPAAKPERSAANPHDNNHPDISAALKQYTAAIEAAPDQAKPYADRGNAYIANRQYAEAIADLDQAIKIDDKNTKYLVERGYLLVNLKQTEQAIKDFSKALELDPSYTKALTYRAITHFRNENFQPALDDCLLMLKNDPSFTDLHITIAQCYFGVKQKDKAVEHLQLYLNTTSDPQGKQEAEALMKEWSASE